MGKINKITEALKFLFIFKKPFFEKLDFIDVIIDNRPFFLVAWELRSGYKINIKEPSKTVKKTSSAVILKLHPSMEIITLTACNLWRKRSIDITLHHTEVDSATAAAFIQQLDPIQTLSAKERNIAVKNTSLTSIKNIIHIKFTVIHFPSTLHFKNESLKYP